MTHLNSGTRIGLLLGLSAMALSAASAHAAPTAPSPAPPPADQGIAEGSDIVVTATRANEIAPVTASLKTTQPQAIVSRSFIDESLPPTADFNQIALITPSVSNYGGNNGVGLGESKAQIRGFQDGEYNVAYDGVPFGDTNDPTHHSTTFFPDNTIETLVVDRGPGNASQLGQATFGGTLNLFSRATRDSFGGEVQASYGSFNTYLARGLLQTGAVQALGGTEFVFTGQYVKTDGRSTFSPYQNYNLFGKAMVPVGPDASLTFIATYNRNKFNQADSDGSTLAQQALFGKYYALNDDPRTSQYFGYNHTDKTTDFEIIKFEAHLAPATTFENRAYTYYYDNETLSANDVTTLPGTIYNTVAADGKTKLIGNIPGYTKTNQYRVYGDIMKLHWDFGFGALTVGAWLEFSKTYRQQRDIDLTTGLPNYVEKAVIAPGAPALATNPGAATPLNIKFDQNSRGNHTEEFVELELRPIEGLKITPGFKHVDFNRKIDALYNQTTRYGQVESRTYTANLPFLTINYQPSESFSVYAQYARGYLAPPLSQLYVANPNFSNAEPQKSTNYQVGFVYHGARLSIDADVYLIDFKNKFFSQTIIGQGVVFSNIGGARYKGAEAQVTYAFGNGLALFANASRNYAKTTVFTNPATGALVPSTNVAKAPLSTAAAGIIYKHGPIRFSLTDKYTGPQYADLANLVRIDPYNTMNLAVSYDIGPIRIGGTVTDLLDSQKINQISGTLATGQVYYQPGRAITGYAIFKF